MRSGSSARAEVGPESDKPGSEGTLAQPPRRVTHGPAAALPTEHFPHVCPTAGADHLRSTGSCARRTPLSLGSTSLSTAPTTELRHLVIFTSVYTFFFHLAHFLIPGTPARNRPRAHPSLSSPSAASPSATRWPGAAIEWRPVSWPSSHRGRTHATLVSGWPGVLGPAHRRPVRSNLPEMTPALAKPRGCSRRSSSSSCSRDR